MGLVTHTSTPAFKRSTPPLSRLLFLLSICLAMLVSDLRFQYLEFLRQTLSVITHPLQVSAAAPVEFLRNATVYFATLIEVQMENAQLRREQLEAAQRLLRFGEIERENEHLRSLLGLHQTMRPRGIAAEILYNAPDPFSRKVILNRGARDGILPGYAVVDANGMIGQVSRAYPVQTEVTLLTDKNQSIPVKVERTGLHGVLFGTGSAPLELRFLPNNTDLAVGDRLLTSGIDGVFLTGLPVAKIIAVTPGEVFLSVQAEAVGDIGRANQVLVLGRAQAVPPMPDPSSEIIPPEEAPLSDVEPPADGTPDAAASTATPAPKAATATTATTASDNSAPDASDSANDNAAAPTPTQP